MSCLAVDVCALHHLIFSLYHTLEFQRALPPQIQIYLYIFEIQELSETVNMIKWYMESNIFVSVRSISSKNSQNYSSNSHSLPTSFHFFGDKFIPFSPSIQIPCQTNPLSSWLINTTFMEIFLVIYPNFGWNANSPCSILSSEYSMIILIVDVGNHR